MEKMKMWLVGLVLLVIAAAGGMVVAGETVPEQLNRAVIRVNSLSCGGCFSTISRGLSELEGYSGMGANLFRKRIAVDFTDLLTEDEILEKLAAVGYPGELESVEQISGKEAFASMESRRRGAGGGCCSGGVLGNGDQGSRNGACDIQNGCGVGPENYNIESL